MVYVNSTSGMRYGNEDFHAIVNFLAGCFGFQLVNAPEALEIINHLDLII